MDQLSLIRQRIWQLQHETKAVLRTLALHQAGSYELQQKLSNLQMELAELQAQESMLQIEGSTSEDLQTVDMSYPAHSYCGIASSTVAAQRSINLKSQVDLQATMSMMPEQPADTMAQILLALQLDPGFAANFRAAKAIIGFSDVPDEVVVHRMASTLSNSPHYQLLVKRTQAILEAVRERQSIRLPQLPLMPASAPPSLETISEETEIY